jgi:DASS family divalent anion:Na+ symporter
MPRFGAAILIEVIFMEDAKSGKSRKKLLQALIGAVIFIAVKLLPCPEALTPQAMTYIAVFLCAMFFLVVDIIPDYLVTILTLSAFIILGVSDLKSTFAPFAQSTVWLLIGAFGIGAAVSKSGLLKRFALMTMRLFPENYRGQVLALLSTGTVIGPLIPSGNVKCTILAPFAVSMNREIGFEKSSKGAAGLFSAMFIPTGVTAHGFYSGSVLVFITLSVLPDGIKSGFTWLSWFQAAFVWMFATLILSYCAIMLLYKPQSEGKISKGFAQARLEELGPMAKVEKQSVVVLSLTLIAWMTERLHGVDSGIVAIMSLAVFCILGIVDRPTFRGGIAWDSIIFIGGIMSVSAQLTALKIDKWISSILSPVIQPLVSNIFLFIPILCAFVYLVRFVVISQTAVLAIFYAILAPLTTAAGMNPWVLSFSIMCASCVWNLSFHNTMFLSALAATKGEMVVHKDVMPMSVAYMVINIAALMLSILPWKLFGLM